MEAGTTRSYVLLNTKQYVLFLAIIAHINLTAVHCWTAPLCIYSAITSDPPNLENILDYNVRLWLHPKCVTADSQAPDKSLWLIWFYLEV